MPPQQRAPELVGRDQELARLSEWVDGLRDGPGGLLITGEAGIGKSDLWAAATAFARANGIPVLVSRPVEAELPLGYAGLGDLFGVVAEPFMTELPPPQASALAAALSRGVDDESSDPLLVGRAVRTLLGLLAGASPVVVAVDDVQWLDAPSARALAYAARRLDDDRVGFALSVRSGYPDPVGIASTLGERSVEMPLGALSLGAIGHIVRARVDPNLPRRTVLEIFDRSAGNPFFAIQLARAGERSLPPSLRDLVRDRLDAVAAARSAIEAIAVLGPLSALSVPDATEVDAAVAAGVLVEIDGTVRFAHPLLAAGAYEQIPPGRRRALHRAAARAAEGLEERARHLALAASSPDAATAGLLDDAARLADQRGAPESAAELALHAVRLTPRTDPGSRAKRTMDRADYLFRSADEPGARRLAEDLLATGVKGSTRVRALGLVALSEADPRAAVATLEEAVAEPIDDRRLAIRTRAQLAWQRGAWLGDIEPAIVDARSAVEQAEALGDAAPLATALAAAGQVLSVAGRPGAAAFFRRALDVGAGAPRAVGDHSARIAFAHERWWRGDFATAGALLAEERQWADQFGDEGTLMRLNIFGSELAMRRGNWDEAADLIEDALADARGYWRAIALGNRAILRGRRGDPRAAADAEGLRDSPAAAADPIFGATADFALGLLNLAEGRIAEAAERMVRLPMLSEGSPTRGAEYAPLVPETVAVLLEADRSADAEGLTQHLEGRHLQLEPWGRGASALCRGLLALGRGDLVRAARHLAEAHDALEAVGCPWDLAQCLTAEARLLRRAGRSRDAAGSLERATSLLARLGADPARQRAEDALRRARPRPRRIDSLTAAEMRVAAIVATGSTNREVAARLFTTVATVEAHLTRIYAKLGIRSRGELARRVGDGSVRVGVDADDRDEP